MALEIRENDGFFEISGRVNAQNIGVLDVYFATVLEEREAIVVSIEKVREMDASGALFFEQLYKKVGGQNKSVTIIGKYNDEITKIMEVTKTDYILSSDHM